MTPQAPLPDAPPEELFARFRERGDVAALGALFDATSPTLFRMALALAPDPASAEDAVQETFLTLMAPGSHYDPSRPLLPWMVGILQLKVHEARRRVRRTVDPARLAPPVFPDDPLSAAETGEEVERIRAALDALPEPYRAVAILRWRYGLEPAAIADARNESPGTVRSLLHRAQEKLRSSLRMLPAFLLVGRAPRGMDAVRLTVMAKGAAVAAAVGVSAVSVAVAGGLLMAPKTLVAVAAVLVLGGTAWFTLGPGGMRTAAPPATPVAAVKRPPLPPRPLPPPEPAIPEPPNVPIPSDIPPPVDLSKCDRDLDFFGTAVDEGGRPVAGALIEVVNLPWRRNQFAPDDLYDIEETGPSTRAARDGTFRFRLARGEMVNLRATAGGYGQGVRTDCLAGERVDLVLRIGGGTLLVTVLDEDRRPVPDAGIRIHMGNPGSVYWRTELQRMGVTDERGRCAFPHLPRGRVNFIARHPTLVDLDYAAGEVPASGVLNIEKTLYRGRTVSGQVTDAASGRPIPLARVGSNRIQKPLVSTDVEGRYSVLGMNPKGGSVLMVSAGGYASQGRTVGTSGDVDFPLVPAFTVSGRVVSREGAPVQGARIAVRGYSKGSDQTAYDRLVVLADADGRFRLLDLSYRCPHHDLVVEAKGHGLVAWAFRAPPASEGGLDLGDIPMPVSRAIEGRALDPEGNPIVGRDVTLLRLKGPGDPKSDDPRENSVPGTWQLRRTDDLGRFRFADLGPGRWVINLVPRSAPAVARTVELTAEEDLLDVVLQQAGKTLTFLVTDREGGPIPGIWILSENVFSLGSGGGSASISAMTGSDGRARFAAVPEVSVGTRKGASFSVDLSSGDPAPVWIGVRTEPIVAEGQEVHVVLEPAGLIQGRVLGPGDEPVAEVNVIAYDAAGKPVIGGVGTCNERGEFSLRAQTGGAVTLKVSGERWVPAARPGDVVKAVTPWRAELADVKAPAEGIVLRATKVSVEGTLDLLVLGLDGNPVSGILVHAGRADDGRSGKTDGAGRIHWEGMDKAEWRIVLNPAVPVDAPEDAIPPAPVNVVPDGQEVLLRFRRGVAVDGTVLLPDGTPAAGAILGFNLTSGFGGRARQRTTDDRGRFRLWFGEEVEFRIEAVLKGEGGVVLRGETLDLKPGGAEVTIRLAPE